MTEKKQLKITDKSIDISFDLLEDNEQNSHMLPQIFFEY